MKAKKYNITGEFSVESNIYGLDVHNKSAQASSRIRIFKGSQDDKKFLCKVADEIGTFKIIIDDGSHIGEHIVKSFETLFPYLETNGVYVIEDTQTAYKGKSMNSQKDLDNDFNTVNYFKKFVHGLSYREFSGKTYNPSYWDLNIISIHFFHNLIFNFFIYI